MFHSRFAGLCRGPAVHSAVHVRWQTHLARSLVLLTLASNFVCGQAPINDNCADATPVGDGTFQGTNREATTDGSASCGFIGDPGLRDVWWRYVAPVTGMTTMDTCGSNFDTILSVYAGCGGTEVACNDDLFISGCFTESRVQFAVISGTSYHVRVAGYDGARGDITLHIVSKGTGPECGDGTCDNGESACSCPDDCPGSCGDGCCHPAESCASCPQDCLIGCGDRCCAAGEESSTCPNDCATLADIALFQTCFSPNTEPTPAECGRFDLDNVPGVGLGDFAQFLDRMLVGP